MRGSSGSISDTAWSVKVDTLRTKSKISSNKSSGLVRKNEGGAERYGAGERQWTATNLILSARAISMRSSSALVALISRTVELSVRNTDVCSKSKAFKNKINTDITMSFRDDPPTHWGELYEADYYYG